MNDIKVTLYSKVNNFRVQVSMHVRFFINQGKVEIAEISDYPIDHSLEEDFIFSRKHKVDKTKDWEKTFHYVAPLYEIVEREALNSIGLDT